MSDPWVLVGFVWWGVVFYLLYKEFWRTLKWLFVMFLFLSLGMAVFWVAPDLATVYWWGYGIVSVVMPVRWLWIELSGRGEGEQ